MALLALIVDFAFAVARSQSRYTVPHGVAPRSPSASNSDAIHFGSATFPKEFCRPQTFSRRLKARQENLVGWLVYYTALFGRNVYQVLARKEVSLLLGRKY